MTKGGVRLISYRGLLLTKDEVEHAFQVLLRVVGDLDLAAVVGAVLEADLRGEMLAQLRLEVGDLEAVALVEGRHGRDGWLDLVLRLGRRVLVGADALLHVADREALVQDRLVERHLDLVVAEADEHACVAGREQAVADRGLHARREAEQPQQVGHARAALAHLVGHLLLRQPDLVDEALVAEGDLDGGEVLALDVLYDGHLQHGLRVGLADKGRHAPEPGLAGGAETALARDQLELAAAEGAHGERLDDAQLR